jgi:hypothetical protein
MQSLGFLKHNKVRYEHFFDKTIGTSYLVNVVNNARIFSVDGNGFIHQGKNLLGKIQFTRDTSAAGHHYDLITESETVDTSEIGLPGAEKTAFRYFLDRQ